jgi:hypothetical protein
LGAGANGHRRTRNASRRLTSGLHRPPEFCNLPEPQEWLAYLIGGWSIRRPRNSPGALLTGFRRCVFAVCLCGEALDVAPQLHDNFRADGATRNGASRRRDECRARIRRDGACAASRPYDAERGPAARSLLDDPTGTRPAGRTAAAFSRIRRSSLGKAPFPRGSIDLGGRSIDPMGRDVRGRRRRNRKVVGHASWGGLPGDSGRGGPHGYPGGSSSPIAPSLDRQRRHVA